MVCFECPWSEGALHRTSMHSTVSIRGESGSGEGEPTRSVGAAVRCWKCALGVM